MAGGRGAIVGLAALVVVAVVVWQGAGVADRLGAVAVGLVLGGALGNLIDRAFRGGGGFLGGAVVDFIDFQWWPIFNVADSCVVVGAILLVFVTVLRPPESLEHGRVVMDELVPDVLAGDRVDRFVAMVEGVSRTEAAAWVAQGRVRVDGQVVGTRSLRVRAGQRVEADVEAGVADDVARARRGGGRGGGARRRRPDRGGQARRAGGAPGSRQPPGHARAGVAGPVPRTGRRGGSPATRHRAPPGQGHLRSVAGGPNGRGLRRAGGPAGRPPGVAPLRGPGVGRARERPGRGRRPDRSIGSHPDPDDGVVVGQGGPDPIRGARDLPRPRGGVAAGVPAGDGPHPPDPGPPRRHRPSGGRATLVTAAPAPAWCWLDPGCTRPAWSWRTRSRPSRWPSPHRCRPSSPRSSTGSAERLSPRGVRPVRRLPAGRCWRARGPGPGPWPRCRPASTPRGSGACAHPRRPTR